MVSRELPLLGGILVGWVLLWYLGWAFVFEGPSQIQGYGWPGYVNNAWMIVHRTDVGYDAFRKPLHAAVLGGLGELLGSYADASVVVSSLATVVLVAAAGLAARALSGPWAGGLAAASLPLVAHNANAARWANNYPMMAAAGGAAMALALVAARWPSVLVAALAGVCGGIAWGADGRGGLLALAAGCLLPLALLRAPRPRTLLLPVVFALGLGIGPASDRMLRIEGAPRMPFEEQIAFQRDVALRWVDKTRDDDLELACENEPRLEVPSVEALSRPCARQMLRYNLEKALPSHLPFGIPLALWLGACLLLPGRQGLPGSLRGLCWLLAGLVPFGLQLLWVPMPDRYVLPYAVVLASLVPGGLGRLAETLGRPGSILVGPAAIGLLVWAWKADPAQRHYPTTLEKSRHYFEQGVAIAAVQSVLIQEPAPFLDCSNNFVSTALLPRITSPEPPLLRLMDAGRCLQWIEEAPEGALLGADAKYTLRWKRGHKQVEDVHLDEPRLQAAGWALIMERETFQLWRRAAQPDLLK